MKRIFAAALAAAVALSLVFAAAGCANDDGGGDTPPDYGTLTIADVSVAVGESAKLEPVFSKGDPLEITYTFDGSDIRIEDDTVYALVADKTVEVTATTEHHSTTFTVTTTQPDYGKLVINDVNAWVDYFPSDFVPVYTDADHAGAKIDYEYDESLITLDADSCTVSALKEGTATVKATLGAYQTSFTVNCLPAVSMTGSNYDTSDYNAYKAQLSATWQSEANDGVSTAFIGDSFFDTRYFWTNFDVTYAGKDAFCLGISSTTTFDWEKFLLQDGFFGDVVPKNIVMHLGTNNIYDDKKSVAETVRDIQRLFTLMHTQYPDTGIYYFGISIRAYDDTKIGYTKQVNAQMKTWCSQRDWIAYMDTPSQLTSDKLKDDGCHPLLTSYSIFTDALAETDIVIEDAQIDMTIADISRTKDMVVDTNPSAITYGTETLTRNFVLSGKLDITDVDNNPHVEFRFINFSDRFLIWGNDIKAGQSGDFKVGYACGGTHVNTAPAEDTYAYTAGETLTLEWKIVITDNDAYLYINNELKLVYVSLPSDACNPFRLSSENAACKFYDMEAVTLLSDETAYEAELAAMQDVIDQYDNSSSSANVVRP